MAVPQVNAKFIYKIRSHYQKWLSIKSLVGGCIYLIVVHIDIKHAIHISSVNLWLLIELPY